jgi:hypothetical protein
MYKEDLDVTLYPSKFDVGGYKESKLTTMRRKACAGSPRLVVILVIFVVDFSIIKK